MKTTTFLYQQLSPDGTFTKPANSRVLHGTMSFVRAVIVYDATGCLNDPRTEARKRRKKCADFCEVVLKEGAIEQFFDLGLAAAVKTKDFSWPGHSSLASSTKFDIVVVDKTRI